MKGSSGYWKDSVGPVEAPMLSVRFGVLFPSESGFRFSKQTDGVACRNVQLEGQVLPLQTPVEQLGFPDWMPKAGDVESSADTESVEEYEHPVVTVDVETIPERDYEALPEWVRERGHFFNWDEFSTWVNSDSVWWYGWRDLISELRLWNYDHDASMEHVTRDMTETWESRTEIWEAIDEQLGFSYEVYEYHAVEREASDASTVSHPLPDSFPAPCEGVRWITITGSKEGGLGFCESPWADECVGETVLLLTPNCD